MLKLIKDLAKNGIVLYVSLEEGTEYSLQRNVMRELGSEPKLKKNILFPSSQWRYRDLYDFLKANKKISFVVIDSVQYIDITHDEYKELKEHFPKISFIYISHADGKKPKGKTAPKIEYDVGVKIRVEGYIAFVVGSRFGGGVPYIIYPQRAIDYWGDKYHGFAKKQKDAIAKLKIKPPRS
jgi:hypothetical protein